MDKRVFPAVKAVIVSEGKFLILKQEVAGKAIWDLPGGKVDWGEDPHETLKREVREETNLEIEIQEPLGMCHFFRIPDENQVAVTVFRCRILSGDIDLSKNPVNENQDRMKIDDFRWVSKEEFLSPNLQIPHESYKTLIRSRF
jgi:8-oxo-dGTP diphosphatase